MKTESLTPIARCMDIVLLAAVGSIKGDVRTQRVAPLAVLSHAETLDRTSDFRLESD